MSKQTQITRLGIRDVTAKKGNSPIVVLTAYTAPMAAILDEAVDILLVGDSMGMVLYGMDSTLPVSLDTMIAHGKTVVENSAKACVVVDMPFGSYQESPEQAFRNCARVMKETGCQAIKLEGGIEMAPTVRFLTERGIPVMAHVGLKPQYVHVHGGYRYQGRNEAEQRAIFEDAKAHEEAGAFAVLFECVERDTAQRISKQLKVPSIGIGSGDGCDGQVVVTEDMLGLFDKTPRFIRTYANIKEVIATAAKQYAEDVRAGKFPAEQESYSLKKS